MTERVRRRTNSSTSSNNTTHRKAHDLITNFTKQFNSKNKQINRIYKEYDNFQMKVLSDKGLFDYSNYDAKSVNDYIDDRDYERTPNRHSPSISSINTSTGSEQIVCPLDQASQENTSLKLSISSLKQQIEQARKKNVELANLIDTNNQKSDLTTGRMNQVEFKSKIIKDHNAYISNYISTKYEDSIMNFGSIQNSQFILMEHASEIVFPIGVKILCEQAMSSPGTVAANSATAGTPFDHSKRDGYNHILDNSSDTSTFGFRPHFNYVLTHSNESSKNDGDGGNNSFFTQSTSVHDMVHEHEIVLGGTNKKHDLLGDAISQQQNQKTGQWKKKGNNRPPKPNNKFKNRHAHGTRSRSNSSERGSYIPHNIYSTPGAAILPKKQLSGFLSSEADVIEVDKLDCPESKSGVPNQQQTEKEQKKSHNKDPNRQTYIVSYENISFNDWFTDLHLSSELEEKCLKENSNLLEADNWSNIADDSSNKLAKQRFYRIEAGLWHGNQYLNFLRTVMFERDCNFSLELATFLKIRKKAIINRKAKFIEIDILDKLDHSVTSYDLRSIFDRLCCSISAWILKINVNKFAKLVLKNHENILSQLDLLSKILRGKELPEELENTEIRGFGKVSCFSSNSDSDFYIMSKSSVVQPKDHVQQQKAPTQTQTDNATLTKSILSNTKLREFLTPDRTVLVNIQLLPASDDEQFHRALPWSSIYIQHEYMTTAELESLGFETISQADTDFFVGSGGQISAFGSHGSLNNIGIGGRAGRYPLVSVGEGYVTGKAIEGARNLMSKFGSFGFRK